MSANTNLNTGANKPKCSAKSIINTEIKIYEAMLQKGENALPKLLEILKDKCKGNKDSITCNALLLLILENYFIYEKSGRLASNIDINIIQKLINDLGLNPLNYENILRIKGFKNNSGINNGINNAALVIKEELENMNKELGQPGEEEEEEYNNNFEEEINNAIQRQDVRSELNLGANNPS